MQKDICKNEKKRIDKRVKITIVGSRSFSKLELVDKIISELVKSAEDRKELLYVYSGGATGVDKRVALNLYQYKSRYTYFEEKLPKFKRDDTTYRVTDYFDRNDELIEVAEKVIAFWDGKSAGTRYVIMKCLERKKNVEVIFSSV